MKSAVPWLTVVLFSIGCGAPTTAPDAGADVDAGTNPNPDSGTPMVLTGTLGALGAVGPIVSSWVISNSGETLIYLSSAQLTCATVQTSRWLGSQPAGSQVVEVVIRGTPTSGQTVNVPTSEVNYAGGGRSSSYEIRAASGRVTFTTAAASSAVQGTLQATYADGSSISGPFHAEFCANGQGY